MIVDPQQWAVEYAQIGAHNVTFHAEAAPDPVGLARDVRAAGARVGLAVDRDTPVGPYLELLPHFDLLLVMTIKAGFGGQGSCRRCSTSAGGARRHVDAGHLSCNIEVDAIAADTIGRLPRPARRLRGGHRHLGADDPAEAVRRLRSSRNARWPAWT
jgi:ribulose-phosphate 3-epimerase